MNELILLVLLFFLVVRVNSTPLSRRIVNGEEAELIPYAVRVDAHASGYSTFGGGSLITRRHILTQARIIHGYLYWYANFGSNVLSELDFEVITNVYAHPEFNPDTFEHDIGICVTPVELVNPNIGVIALPAAFANTPVFNDQGIIYGFGLNSTEGFHVPHIMQTSSQRVMNHLMCLDILGDRSSLLTETKFCAIDKVNNSSLCIGDMGAGFIVEVDGIKTITGVASIVTNMCHHSFPAVYTRVSDYLHWITLVTGIL